MRALPGAGADIAAWVSYAMAKRFSKEPEKFGTIQEQDENLENLIAWVRSYETRTDEYGLLRHRALYESFQGNKREFNDPGQYESA